MTHSSKFLLATFVALVVSAMAGEALAKPDKKDRPAENPIAIASQPDLTSITPEPAPVEAAKEIVLPANPPEETPPTLEAAKDYVLPANPPAPAMPVDGSTYNRVSFCGDGRLDQDAGEVCDDGNNLAGDGCYQCKWEWESSGVFGGYESY